MGTENRSRAVGYFIQTLDELGALRLEAFDNIPIVDNFVADIDGRAIFLERTFHDFDRADDASTKSAWLRQNDFHEICLASDGLCL